MTRPIAPGQTVPVPFVLSETPDSTPTLTVYQSTAAGVLSDVSATTSPTVTLLSGLAYHAYFTAPAAALHGSSYQLLVSVTIGSETTTHWLDGGTVELWASQASVDANATAIAAVDATADAIKAKTDLIGTASANLVQAGIRECGEIALRVASYWTGTLTGLGDLTGYSKLWVTIKRSANDADSAAVVQWSDAGGLLYLDRNQGVQSSWGTLTLDDAVAGDITMTLEADAAALLRSELNLVYDVKGLNAGKPVVIAEGVALVDPVITRSIA